MTETNDKILNREAISDQESEQIAGGADTAKNGPLSEQKSELLRPLSGAPIVPNGAPIVPTTQPEQYI